MKCLKKYIVILVFIFSQNLFAQPYLPINNDFNYFIEEAASNSVNFHSEIRPFNVSEIKIDSSKTKTINYKSFEENRKTSLIPIFASDYSNSTKNDFGSSISAGASLKAITKRWYLQVNLAENLTRYPSYMNEKIDSNKIIPHWGRYSAKFDNYYIYSAFTGILVYTPRNYISMAVGYDKNFIGDGYRSMLLSDNSAPYPFAKLTVNAWRIKYFAMLASFSDVNTSGKGIALNQKYGIFHFFSINISKRLTLGFYENIIWRNSDSADYRGIEIAYLNPVIYYRPLEASINSPDNAAIGSSGKLRLWKKTFIYGQFFLDDLLVKEFFANHGWWGNKYGIQAGLKSFDAFGIQDFYTQLEYNFARPYTYSHESSLSNMGNLYQPLTHPLGANFYELIQILRYGKDRWWLKLKASEALYGDDDASHVYGKNIYKSYNLRNSNFGNKTGQGVKTYLTNVETSFNYILVPKWNMNLQAGYKLYSLRNNQTSILNNYIFIGLSTLLYNNETDY